MALILGSIFSYLAAGQVVVLERTSPDKEVLPGELVTHVFSLRNQGEAPVTVRLSATHPADWGLLTPLGELELPPGGEELVFLTLAVPRTARADVYQVALEANWLGGSASQVGPVRVSEVYQVELVAPGDGAALPGGSVVYRFSVVNQGNTVGRFAAVASSAHGWPVEVAPKEVTLAPGERAQVEVEVKVPLGTQVDRDLLQFTVGSLDRPGVEAKASLFTQVLPPTPELVVGSPYAELRAQLGADLYGDLLSSAKGSSLWLRAGGALLGGGLDFSLRLTGPLGPSPYSLASLSLVYSRESTRVEAGDVSLSLTPLLSVSGEGLEVAFNAEDWSLEFLNGWQGEEGRVGGRLSARQGDWEWGLAYREARGAGQAAAADAWTWVPMTEGLRALFEIGLGYTYPFTDRALLVRLEAEAWPPLRLRLDAFSVGPHFPGRRRDQEGIALSGTLEAEPVTFRFTVEHRWDNVWRVPSRPNVVRSSLNLNFEWSPEEWPMGFSSGVAVDRTREEVPSPSTDSRTRRLEVGLTGGESPLSFSLTARWRENVDFVSGAGYHSLEYQERFYLTMDRATAILHLEQDVGYQLDWTPLTNDWSASLTLRSQDSPHRFRFSWTQGHDGGEAGFELEYQLTPDFLLKGEVDGRWDVGGTLTSLRLQAGFSYEFPWEVPFLPAKGWVEGRVFLDSDRDGEFDPGEAGLEAVVLAIGRIRVSTDGRGRFKFPPLEPGEYQVELERLPLGVRPLAPGPFRVWVEVAEGTTLFVPCQLLATVQGMVYDDRDQDGERDPTEPGVPDVGIVLSAAGQEVARTVTDAEGGFAFPNLEAGEYEVALIVESLPERYEPTTPVEARVSLGQGETAEVEFGIWQRPRPIVVTYQPPFADFVWAPEQPLAGQPVKFDGSTSADFDGEITDYAWDFDGDGAPDATGPVVEWTFPSPGTYQVSLTVTDNDGNQDTFTQEVEVSPAE